MSRSLTDRAALVTGAAAGIGKDIALTLAREGASIILVDINVSGGTEAVEEIRAAGGQALFIATDVTDKKSVTAALHEVGERFGKLDMLINNAGASPRKRLADMQLEEWRQIIALNLTSVYLCTHHALPLLGQAASASIINIASMHAFQTVPGLSAYAAAKGGVVSLTRSLAMELSPHIRVNAIAPGMIETEGWFHSITDLSEARRDRLRYHPLGRLGLPSDISACVLFLISDEASFLTGITLPVTGGLGLQLYP